MSQLRIFLCLFLSFILLCKINAQGNQTSSATSNCDCKELTRQIKDLREVNDIRNEKITKLKEFKKKSEVRSDSILLLMDEIKAFAAEIKILKKANKKVAKLEKMIKNKEQEIERLSEKNDKLSKENDKLAKYKGKQKEYKNNLEKLEKEIKENKEELKSLKAEAKERKKEYNTLNKENKALLDKYEKLVKTDSTRKEVIAKLRREKTALQDSLSAQAEIHKVQLVEKNQELAKFKSIKRIIISETKQSIDDLYKLNSLNGIDGKLKAIETQFLSLESFKSKNEVIEMKKRFDQFNASYQILNAGQAILTYKYKSTLVQTHRTALAKVSGSPALMNSSKNLIAKLNNYCRANNKLFEILNIVHKTNLNGNGRGIRLEILKSALQEENYITRDYPFLKEVAEQKQQNIGSNSMPHGLSHTSCH